MEKKYRRLCARLGWAMLFHLLFINVFMLGGMLLYNLLAVTLDDRTYSLGYELVYAVLYLAAFMLPVLLFRILSRKETPVPMGMEPTFPLQAIPMVLAVLGINLACAYCNSFFMQLLDTMGIANLLDYVEMAAFRYPEDFVLLHLSLSLVPAFCEEFLFRGLICARLMPYGKTTAIIASAVLFGLMHGNLGQLFYTTMAGVMLGWCYVETRSIWPCVIAHMLNNLLGFLSEYWYAALPEGKAVLIDTIVCCAVMLAGLICLSVMICSRRRKKLPLTGLGNTRPISVQLGAAMPMRERLRGFFRPSMIVYFVLACGGILFYLLLGGLFAFFE